MNTRTRLLVLSLILAASALVLSPAAYAADEETPVAPADPTAPVPLAARTDDGSAAEELDLSSVPVEELGEIVVTATRVPTLEFNVPRSINVVQKRRIFERGVTSAIDALDDQVGIWVEKRTSHSSDLVIRGLSGTNILALVDGNTLSTFWGEGGFAGDDMYGKIDPGSIERIEVVRGPSSVLYGSNALGAVINFITKESPLDYTTCGTCWGGRTFALAGTSTSGWRVRQEGWGASPRFRWFGGVTYMDWGSTEDGGGQRQTPTAARGWYADVAVNYLISDIATAKFTFQYTGLDPVYRYYRPTQDNQNLRLAFAGTVEFHDLARRTGICDAAKLTLYFQNKEDERRWFDAATKEQTRWGIAKWRTMQVDLQAEKQLCNHGLTYGIEFESTWGESPDDEQFTLHYPTGVIDKPAPDSVWSSLGGYIQDVWKISPHFTLTGSLRVDGLRFSTDVDEHYNPPGGLDPSVDEFTDWQLAVAGGIEGTWHMTDTTNMYGGWTRGFRQFAPRFGVSQHAWGVVVPNQFLDPVTADQFEVGVKHRSENWNAGVVGYYTYFNNFQNVVPSTFLGSDWYDYNGNGIRDPDESVYVNVGNGTADLYGVEAYAEMNLAALGCRFFDRAWTASANFTYNYGQDNKNDIPMRHTQPMSAVVRLRWEPPRKCRRPWAEIQGKFADRFDRIPPDRLAHDVGYYEDPQDSASGMRRTWGLPGYSVWDLRAGFILNERVEFTVGLGNIFDKLYRPAHSRWDAPGRNVYASVSITF